MAVVVTFQEMKKGTVWDPQFLPIFFQLHLQAFDQTKISKQLLVFIKNLKYLTYNTHFKKIFYKQPYKRQKHICSQYVYFVNSNSL